MSRSLGSELPPDMMTRLSGRDLAPLASKVIQVLTVDTEGWPHAALLSYFEVVAKDPRRIRMATYGTSTTTANLRRTGKVTLVLVDERLACYIKATASPMADSMRTADWNAAFDCRIEQVLVDEVNEEYEPGAYVASGITYVNPQRGAELARARGLLAELLER